MKIVTTKAQSIYTLGFQLANVKKNRPSFLNVHLPYYLGRYFIVVLMHGIMICVFELS